MRLPRRHPAETNFDADREATLLGHDDGSALATFFVDLRYRLTEIPEVAPSPEVVAYLQDEQKTVEARRVAPHPRLQAVAGESPPSRRWRVDRPNRAAGWLVSAAVLVAVGGGGAALWAVSSQIAASNSEVSAELASTGLGHDANQGATTTVDLGSAGAVTVDRTGERPILTDVRPAAGWQVTDERGDGTELTFSDGNREMVTVSLVIDDPDLWVEISSTSSNQTARLSLAEADRLPEDDDESPSEAADDVPAGSPNPEPAGTVSGFPVTGVAPRGGDPTPSSTSLPNTTTTEAEVTSTTTTTSPPTSTTATPTTAATTTSTATTTTTATPTTRAPAPTPAPTVTSSTTNLAEAPDEIQRGDDDGGGGEDAVAGTTAEGGG